MYYLTTRRLIFYDRNPPQGLGNEMNMGKSVQALLYQDRANLVPGLKGGREIPTERGIEAGVCLEDEDEGAREWTADNPISINPVVGRIRGIKPMVLVHFPLME